MIEVLSILWTILSFILSILWAIVWFILRDLLSTIVWLGIVVWLGFVLRYRGFNQGSLALLRYGRHGVMLLWRWLRGRPGNGALPQPEPVTKVVKEYQQRVPYGYASVSEQMNVVLISLIIIMANI